MGLLTDPHKRRLFSDIITKYKILLCVLCYITAFVWFLALACVPLNASTYFSENALLPGVVESYFSKTREIIDYSDDLHRHLKANKRTVPKSWLYERFREIGLDVYTQNFSIHYPLNLLRTGQVHTTLEKTVDGQNIYAVLRAPRAASTEAIVISAPFRPLSNPQMKTHVGIALLISLAKYFSMEPYWAKDVIFLVTEQEYGGMKAWLDAYHGQSTSQYIVGDDIYGHSGSIQAAINLELGYVAISHMNVNIEGLNGQLPNLDLFNLVTKLCSMEGLQPMLHRRTDPKYAESLSGYKHSLITMAMMMWNQATGSTSGNHGFFHQYNIEAVTLEGVKRSRTKLDINAVGRCDGGLAMSTLVKKHINENGAMPEWFFECYVKNAHKPYLRIVEGCVRSLNNLLERFHQSFFFYLLPATNRYISIGLYMPPFALMVTALLLEAIALWIVSSKNKMGTLDERSKRSQGDSKAARLADVDNVTEPDQPCNPSDDFSDEDNNDDADVEQSTLFQALPLFTMSLTLATVLYISPSWFAAASPTFKLSIDDSLTFGLLAVFASSLSLSSVLGKLSEEGALIKWERIKAMGLIALALVLFSTSLINICLAAFIAAVMIPPALIVRPVRSRLHRWIQLLLLLFISPPALLIYASFIHTIFTTKTSLDTMATVTSTFSTVKRIIFLAILDGHLIGNWTYALSCFAVIPGWLFLWAIGRILPVV